MTYMISQKSTNLLTTRRRSESKITYLPFYGGAKGQTLEIMEDPDGSVTTKVLQTKYSDINKPESQIAKDIRDIHRAALEIIRLHEQTKNKQRLNDEERERYDKGIEQLNLSSKNLAQMQVDDVLDDTEQRSNLQFWFEKKKEKFGGVKSGEKEEENVGEETGGQNEGDSESVQVNLPPPDASVAEAKPVGLAVAGAGGVAASKPIATAVVGPGGLAIARPVATAIAGVSPEDAVIPLTGEGYLKFPSDKKKEKCKQKNCEEEKDKNKKPEKEKTTKDEDDDYIERFRFKSYYHKK